MTDEMAWNRKRPRARRWTLDTLDRDRVYQLKFDGDAFRWELADVVTGEPVVTRTSINRRSRYSGDRETAGDVGAEGSL